MKENDEDKGLRMEAIEVTEINDVKKDEFNPHRQRYESTEWKKGELPPIIPLESMAYTAEKHPPFKGRDHSGHKIHMENNVNECIHQRGGDALSDAENEGTVTSVSIESEDTNIEENKSQKRSLKVDSADIDDPKRGACNIGDYAKYRQYNAKFPAESTR